MITQDENNLNDKFNSSIRSDNNGGQNLGDVIYDIELYGSHYNFEQTSSLN